MQASDKPSPKQQLIAECSSPAALGGTPPRATAMSHNEPPDGLSTLKNERGLLEGAMAGRQAAGRGF
jgi:hypothetical protein